MSLDESCLAGLKIFFRVHVVRIFLHLVSFGFFTVVNTFFQIILHDVHLCDDSLDTNQLVCHFTA